MKKIRRLPAAAGFVLTLSLAAAAIGGPPRAMPAPPSLPPSDFESVKNWHFCFTLPGWAAGLSGEVGVLGLDPVSVDVPFKDVLENLDAVAMLTVEAQRGPWSLILDGLYMKLSAGGETPGRLLSTIDIEVEQVLAEAALGYRLLEGPCGYLDLLVGARYVYLASDVRFNVNPAGVRSVSRDLSDAVVDRAVDLVRDEVGRAVNRARSKIAALDLEGKAEELRKEIRREVIERILERTTIRDIIETVRNLTPAQREQIRQKIENAREVIEANKELARALVEERVAGAIGGAKRKAQQAVARARKNLAQKMESTIREAIPESAGGSKSWVDPFIGLRGRLNLTERIYLAGRGDIGGFGAGSELAYNLFGGIGCQLTPSVATEIGWRHLAMDYSKGGFVYDAETSGAYLGLRIRF